MRNVQSFLSRFSVLAILAVPVAVALHLPGWSGVGVDTTSLMPSSPVSTFPVLHWLTNSYFTWQSDLVLALMTRPWGMQGYQLALVGLAAAGVAYATAFREGRTVTPGDAAGGAACALAVAAIFGRDCVVLSLLAAVPWMLAALTCIDRAPAARAAWYFTGLTGFLSVGMLGAVMLPASVLCIAVSLLDRTGSQRPFSSRAFGSAAAFLLVLGATASILTRQPASPSYPEDAHLVPSWGVADGLQPLVGERLSVVYPDREALRRDAAVPAVTLLFLTLVIAAVGGLSRRPDRRQACVLAALFLSAAAAADTVLSPYAAQMAPLQSASRIFPGLFPMVLTPSAMALALMFLCIPLRSLCATAGALLAFVSITGASAPHLAPPEFPLFSSHDAKRLLRVITETPLPENDFASRVMRSPSFAVVARRGMHILGERNAREALNFQPISAFHGTVSASKNPDAVAQLADERESTRWTTATGRQTGEEWILLRTPLPIALQAVRLRSGRFFTDFPRGVELRTAASCDDAAPIEIEHFQSIDREERTEGAIHYTAEGFPYFGDQYSSILFTPKPVLTNCILVRQIGNDGHFDWSVAELDLAVAPSAPSASE